MRNEVVWAIRDSRELNASDNALLYAVETRGTAFGTSQNVAADAGLGRSAFYSTRDRLKSYGVLNVTEREGRTTVYGVNADWFSNDTRVDLRTDPCGNPAGGSVEIRNDPCRNPTPEVEQEVDRVSGLLKDKNSKENRSPVRRIGGPIYLRMVRPEEVKELKVWDRSNAMTPEERAEWHALIEP